MSRAFVLRSFRSRILLVSSFHSSLSDSKRLSSASTSDSGTCKAPMASEALERAGPRLEPIFRNIFLSEPGTSSSGNLLLNSINFFCASRASLEALLALSNTPPISETASAAVLLVQTEVPFGVIFAYFMLNEKPTARALVGIGVAFIGVYILIGSPNLDGKFLGITLTILGSAIWALGQVVVKPLSKEINPLALVAWLALFSGPTLIFLSSIIEGDTINHLTTAKLNHWVIAFYIGLIMQPITYGCFYYVLKNNPLYKVLPIVTMGIPPTGLLAAIFLLGEKPTTELFIGGTVIILGVIMILYKKKDGVKK